MHWLSSAEAVPLDEGHSSFLRLVMRWIHQALVGDPICLGPPADTADAESRQAPAPRDGRRRMLQRFFDQLEANADALWQVPELETARELLGSSSDPPDESEDAEEDDVYSAAYEDVIYRDSTDDGIESEMLEAGGEPTDYELEGESSRLAGRMAVLTTVARIWKTVALAAGRGIVSLEEHAAAEDDADRPLIRRDTIAVWLRQAGVNRARLDQLIQTIERQPISASSASQEALIEYDRRRVIKETLLEKVIATSVAMTEAQQLLEALAGGETFEQPLSGDAEKSEDWQAIVRLWRAVLAGDATGVRSRWHAFLAVVRRRPLLYVPLTKGGDGRKIAAARNLQHTFRELLRRLPRLGLLRKPAN